MATSKRDVAAKRLRSLQADVDLFWAELDRMAAAIEGDEAWDRYKDERAEREEDEEFATPPWPDQD